MNVPLPDGLLVLLALSKQSKDPLKFLSAKRRIEAEAALNAAIAKAKVTLEGAQKESCAAPAQKKQKSSSKFADLFDSDEEVEEKQESQLAMWKSLPKSTVDAHRDASGIVNHLTLVSSVKSDMPVIYEVYSQHAASSVVSSNTESFFSLVFQIQDNRKTMSSS